ncbi:hypothetical protein LXL04_011675 [Taraxacum kok-saghyz]
MEEEEGWSVGRMVVDGGCIVEFRQEFVELFLNSEIYSRALTRFFPNGGRVGDSVISAGTPPSLANLSPPATAYPDSTPGSAATSQEDGNRQGKDIVRAQRHGEGNQEMEWEMKVMHKNLEDGNRAGGNSFFLIDFLCILNASRNPQIRIWNTLFQPKGFVPQPVILQLLYSRNRSPKSSPLLSPRHRLIAGILTAAFALASRVSALASLASATHRLSNSARQRLMPSCLSEKGENPQRLGQAARLCRWNASLHTLCQR